METIKELEKEIEGLEKKWKTPRDDKGFTKRNMRWFEARIKLHTLKEVLKVIDEFFGSDKMFSTKIVRFKQKIIGGKARC